MIRIKPNKCGYSNWSCQGIPQLSSFMFDASNATVSTLDSEIYKLPVKIKGMVYTEDTINMGWQRGGPHPEIPELTCRKDTDPDSDSQDPSVHKNYILVDINGSTYQYPVYGGTGGWLDLFNAGYDVSGATQYFYHDLPVPGSTAQPAAVTDVYLTVDGATTRNQIYDIDNIPSFQKVTGDTVTGITVTELEMGPGLLEPMLDTSFDPIGIDTIPAWEAGNDSFIFEAAVLNAWKGVVDDRIRNIYARINDIHPGTDDTKLRDLKNKEYEYSECNNFQIKLHYGGDALRTYAEVSSGGLGINTYDISGGTVTAGGSQYVVAPLSGCTAPFYAYLTAIPDYTATYSGQVLPDAVSSGAAYANGGTVTAITQPTTSDTNYYWTVTYPVRTGVSVTISSAATEPAPADGIAGIGGVQVVSGGTRADDFVLFKIFQEDCVVSIGLPDEAGMVNHYYPSSLPPDGPEYSAGLVYPYDNIVSGMTGTDRLDWGHSAYVPTVNATYEFVHGESYGGDDYVASDQALAKAFVTQGGTSAKDYEVITTSGAPEEFLEPYRNQADAVPYSARAEVVNARTVYSAAESTYNDKYTSWVNAGSPVDPDDSSYVYYLQALEAYESAGSAYTSAYNAAYSEVIGGTPGTVYVLKDIVWSDGLLVPDGKESITVPTVVAVYEFMHGPYALNDYGTVARPSSGSAYVAHGTPGTVYTVDEVDRSVYLTGGTAYGYLYSEVPTVKAMVDYVTANGGSGEPAVPGTILLSVTNSTISEYLYNENPEQGEVLHKMGSVQPTRNILIGNEDPNAISPEAVPTVEAVYSFIHYTPHSITGNTTTADIFANPLAEIAGMTYTHAAGGGESITGVTVCNEPGTVIVASDIKTHDTPVMSGTDIIMVRRTFSACVPTAQAVIDYIDIWGSNYKPVQIKAVPDGIRVASAEISSGGSIYTSRAETWVHSAGDSAAHSTGIIDVTANVLIGPEPYPITTSAVPSVKAVYDFIHTDIIDNVDSNSSDYTGAHEQALYTLGTMQLGSASAGGAADRDLISGGTPGTTFVASNVLLYTPQNSNCDARYVVPTIEAVYSFVHNAGTSNIARALADVTCITSDATSGIVSVTTSGLPGTIRTVDHIYWNNFENPPRVFGSHDYVPTVSAVAEYMDTYVPPYAVLGHIGISGGSEFLTSATADVTPQSGTVQTVNQVLIGSANNTESVKDVPTVKAVWDFMHNSARDSSTPTSYTQALATPGAITLGEHDVESWDGTPGTVEVATNVQIGSGTWSEYAVPTVSAVHAFLHNDGTTADIAGALATVWSLSSGSTDSTATIVTSGIPGTIQVYNSICLDSTGTTPVVVSGASGVPTMNAVSSYVASYGGGGTEALVRYTSQSADWGAITTVTDSEGKAGSVLPYNELLVSSNGNVVSVGGQTNGVPTVQAVYNFVHSTYAKATIGATTVGTGATSVTASGTVCGTVEVASNIRTIDTVSSKVTTRVGYTSGVPTMNAVVQYLVNGGEGTATGNGTVVITDITSGTNSVTVNSSGLAGTFRVCNSICVTTAGSPATSTVYMGGSAVPTMSAVVAYVSANGGGYSGPFKATTTGINSGHMWFNGSSYAANSSAIALADGAVAYAVLSKGTSGLAASLSTTAANTATAVSYPVASRSGNTVIQLQYGDINVTGRWM